MFFFLYNIQSSNTKKTKTSKLIQLYGNRTIYQFYVFYFNNTMKVSMLRYFNNKGLML